MRESRAKRERDRERASFVWNEESDIVRERESVCCVGREGRTEGCEVGIVRVCGLYVGL